MFTLTQPALLRVTIMRVYPTCKRVGAFVVRGEAGLNGIRFRGRWRGRALPQGSYRLVIRALGARRDAAAIPIVVSRHPLSSKRLRRLRSASVCREPIADVSHVVVAAAAAGGTASGGGVLGEIKDRIEDPVDAAAGVISRTARQLPEHLKDATGDPFNNPFILTLIGAIALASAILGTIVLMRVLKLAGFRDYY